MSSLARSRVREVFEAAADIPESDRAAFLDRACAGDNALRSRIESLLNAMNDAGGFLNDPTSGGEAAAAATIASASGESPGAVIGRYKLLQHIGEGGFGVVFLAEQREPVVRKVALKVIKLGMDTRAVIARFEAERQALAMMDHPNIAKVLDAGSTDTGRPYFVMELVKGDPITNYCDTNNLSIAQRLDLFQQVCHAVQHAHQKGVIHRDIKPSNVLVTVADGKPIPKVIDFGIAKATSARLTEKTLFTEHRALIGTPEYMSPEQAEMSGVDIDTRSDIYSLGVLLYELLTGALPFDAQRLRSAAFGEIQRIIREEEPPNPSTRLSTLKGTLPDIAAHRRTEPGKLSSSVRGDLDWIVMRALEKDRTRRYDSANNLAEDVQRHLDGEPVLAAPPSAAYRMRKFVRRHRVGVAAGIAIAAALILGIVGTTVGFLNARAQRDRAQSAERAEKTRADELKQVSDFQANMLAQVDSTKAGQLLTQDVTARFEAALAKAGVPEDERTAQVESFESQWRKVNATDAARELIDRTILHPAIHAIDTKFKDQPVVDAQLRQVLADRYRELGLYQVAMPLQERALETRRRVLGDENPETIVSIGSTGALLADQGRFAEAEPYFRETLEMSRRVLGEEHRSTLTAINNMGFLLSKQGKGSEAEPYYREALETRRRVLGEDHPDTLVSLNNMGLVGEAAERARRVLGEDHPTTLAYITNLGLSLKARGEVAVAEPYLREALDKSRRVLGEEHPQTIVALNNMGTLLANQRKPADAEPFFREAMEKGRRVLGSDHPTTLTAIGNLGVVLKDQVRLTDAEPFFREAMEMSGRALGPDSPISIDAVGDMASLLKAQGKPAAAEALYERALEGSRRVLGPDHPGTLVRIESLALLLQDQGKLADAEPLFRESLDLNRRLHPGDNPQVLLAIVHLAFLLERRGNLEGTASLCREAVAMERRLTPAGSPSLPGHLAHLGAVLLAIGTPQAAAEAEPVLRECLGIWRAAFPAGSPQAFRTFNAMSLLGGALVGVAQPFALDPNTRIAKLSEAEPLLLDGYAGLKDLPSAPAPDKSLNLDPKKQTLERIVRLYETWESLEPGKGYAKKAEEWSMQSENGH